MKRILILGAGTAGTCLANQLRRALHEKDWGITVVDKDDQHIYRPGLLFVPFGFYRPDELHRSRRRLLDAGIELVLEPSTGLDLDQQRLNLASGAQLNYDILVIATGTSLSPESTDGMTGEGWRKSVFDFYSLDGAAALAHALDSFEGGRLVVNTVETPISCPVAPMEFAFLADAHFTQRGRRNDIEIVFSTPLDGAFTRPVASQMLGDLLDRRNIDVVTDFYAAEVDGGEGQLKSYDGRVLPFDLLVTVPRHMGAPLVRDAGLGDESGFVPTDRHTLRTRDHENVFALGDAADLPTSKAGAAAHFQAEILADNILRHIAGRELEAAYDGHVNCFIETGFNKAMLVDFNYNTEPLPGRFPLAGVGPLKLLEESHTNHWAKLAFRWVYWNLMVRGEPLPVSTPMSMRGKREVQHA